MLADGVLGLLQIRHRSEELMLLSIVFGASRPNQQLIVYVSEQGDLNLRQDGGSGTRASLTLIYSDV